MEWRQKIEGIISNIKEAVQEPTDETAPNNKFHFRSVNVFDTLGIDQRDEERSRRRSDSHTIPLDTIHDTTDDPAKYESSTSHSSFVWTFFQRQQTWVFLLVLAISSAILALSMEETAAVLINLRNAASSQTDSYALNYFIWLLTPIPLVLVAAVGVHMIGPYAAGSGIPAMKSILSGVLLSHYLSFRTFITKAIGLVCAYSAGLFVGKEGPYVHICSALAYQLGRLPVFRRLRKNESTMFQMLAAGCAVGVAVTFGAPIGGVIFSIEVTSTYYLMQNLSKAFFCAVCATLFVRVLDGNHLISFFETEFEPYSYSSYELIAFCLIGVVAGLLGAVFIKYVKLVQGWRRTLKIVNTSRYGQLIVITLLSALVSFPIVPLRSGPSSVISDLFKLEISPEWSNPNKYFMLSVAIILEFLLSGASIGLAIPCGLYTPVFVIGTLSGRLLGEIMAGTGIPIVPAAYAVVGAAAFAAGVTRTLSSAIIIFELTGQMSHLLPVLLAVLISSAVGSIFGPSLYDELLKMKGLPYMPPFKSHGNKHVPDLMRTDVPTITYDTTFDEISKILLSNENQSFPFLDVNKIMLGVISRPDLERLLEGAEKENVGDDVSLSGICSSDGYPLVEGSTGGLEMIERLIQPCPFQIDLNTALYKVHFMFAMLGLAEAYVLSHGKFVGMISKEDLMDS